MVSDCVNDASAMALASSGKTDAASELRARLVGMRKHAQHLIDAEVGNVLRRHERKTASVLMSPCLPCGPHVHSSTTAIPMSGRWENWRGRGGTT